MDNNDMNSMIDYLKSILNNSSNSDNKNNKTVNNNVNNIPPNIREALESLANNSNTNSDSKDSSSNSNIDIGTIMKMQQIINAMNAEESTSRSNLLRSLKPYLKPSRQQKVDQCIQLLNIEKVFEIMNKGGNKNDQ